MPPECTPVCPRCGEQKPPSSFYALRPGRNSYGNCRSCWKVINRVAHEKNRAKRLEGQRLWYENNREGSVQRNRRWYEQNKGRHKDNQQRWLKANPGRQAELAKAWYERNREKTYESAKQWNQRNPGRVEKSKKASMAVYYAIKRGALRRPRDCEECGETGGRIEAAHADYALPLDVRWLCRSCHTKWDQQSPKTL